MTRPFVSEIRVLGVSLVQRTEVVRQAVVVFGYDDSMYVIWHQAISQNLDCRTIQEIPGEIQISTVVLLVEESRLSTYPALSNMVRKTWDHQPLESRHTALRCCGKAPILAVSSSWTPRAKSGQAARYGEGCI